MSRIQTKALLMLLAHSKCILFVTYFIALIYFISYIALHPFIIIYATAQHIPGELWAWMTRTSTMWWTGTTYPL